MAFHKANALKKITVSLLILFFVALNNTVVAQGPGAAWEYSRSISLTPVTPLANYQVKVILTAGQYTNMNADGSDLRFYDNATIPVLCNYWIEKWNNLGTSVVWVKVPTSGASALTMYYGNPAATSLSNGNTTFDFFDDFNGNSLNANWTQVTTHGTITISGSNVTLNNTGGGTGSGGVGIYSSFAPLSTSFIVEAKHKEAAYWRNRFYVLDASNPSGSGGSNSVVGLDYGFFGASIYWGGSYAGITANTDYLTRWDITDGTNTPYIWSNYLYNTGVQISSNSTTLTKTMRYLSFRVTEQSGTSTSIDWARVRKSSGTTPDIASTVSTTQVQLPPSNITFAPASFCAGSNDLITINGTYLNNTTAVSINGVNATTITPISISQIQVVFPSGISTGPIKVTTAGGSATSAAGLTINLLPALFNVGGGGSYCAGGAGLAINLSGSETGVNYQLIKDASNVGSPVAGTGSAISFGLQTATGAYSVIATNGTTTCQLPMNGSTSVIINALPIAYNVTPANGSYCAGGAGAAVGLDGSQAGVNYQLYSGATAVGAAKPGTGGAITFGNQPFGTYTVLATNSSTTCTQNMAGSAVITANALPIGSLTVTENSGTTQDDNKICVGDAITFTATSGFSSYTFKVNGSLIQTSGSNIFTPALAAGNSTVTVDVTDVKGCNSTFAPIPVTTSVSTLPNATLTSDLNNVCPGTRVTFAVPYVSGSTYSFKVNGGVPKYTGLLNTYSSTTLNNNDVVTAEVTNSNGCTATSSPLPMIVKPMPAPAGTITGGAIVCQGQNGVSFSIPSIANATGYTWTLPAGMTIATASGTNSITVNFSSTATSGNISVAGTNGCGEGPASVFSVIVNPLPTASVAGDAGVCQNAPAPTITFTGAGGTAPYIFSYNINGGATQTVVSAGNIATVTAPTAIAGSLNYNLTGVKDASATTCFNPVTGSSVTIKVSPLPTASITGNTTVCEAGTEPSITFTGSNGTAPYIFSYNINGGATQTITSTGNTATITAPTNGGTLTYNLIGVQDGSPTACFKTITGASVVIAVNSLPKASISVVDPKVCQNSPVRPVITFTGSVGPAPFTFTYNINGGANQTIITTSGNSVNLPAPVNLSGTFIYNLVSVKSNSTGCGNPQTGSVSITIDTLPVPVLIGPDQICPDQVLDYETQSNDGIHNYTWTISNGTVISGGGVGTMNNTAEVHWANNTSSKSIYVNYTDGNGCSGNTSVSVISASPTKPVIDPAGPNSVCLNTPGHVYTTQTSYSNYTWSITGGEITSGGTSTDNTATVTWNTSGPQSISVNFNSGTCSAPAPTVYPVMVNTLPTASAITNNAAVCQDGTSPIITFTGANGAAPYTFSYTINGLAQTDIVSSGNSGAITVPATTPGDYIYEVTNVTGSNTCTQSQSNVVTITVNPLPTASIDGTVAVCKGSASPLITFTGTNGTAPYTFTYSINGVTQPVVTATTGNSISVSANTSVVGPLIYSLISVKDAKGCPQVVAGQTATITVNPLPAAIMTGPAAVCLNDVANITFTGNNGTPPYTFTYTIDGASNQTVTTTIGNSITVPVTTSISKTSNYQLISVQDGSTTSCAQNQTGNVTVLISPVSVGGTLTGGATVCTGTNSGTVNLASDKVGNVIGWESSTDGGTNWVRNTVNKTNSLPYSNLTQTIQYRAVVQSGTCTEATSNAVTITVNTANGGTLSGSGTTCAGSNGSIILSGNTGNVLRWEASTDNGVNWVIQASAGTNNYLNYTGLSQTTWYRAQSQASPCATAYSDIAKVIINQRPKATITGASPICVGGSTTITLNLTGTGIINGILSNGTTGVPFNGTSASPVILNVTPSTSTTYSVTSLTDANCSSIGSDLPGYATIVVNPLPAPVVITPGNTTICSGTILPLTSVLNNAGNFTSTYSSLSNNILIPDNNATGISNAITVPANTIPVGAIFDSVTVTFNIIHPDVSDLAINLSAPNGKTLTLAVFSLAGQNLTGTTVSSRTNQYPVISTGTSPYSGKYSAEGDGLYAAQDPLISNTRNFTDLFGTQLVPPNGTWSLKIRDNWDGNTGTLKDWSLKIYYHVPVDPVNIVWSPFDSLFNDPSAKVPYTGDARATVYAKPAVTTIYTGKASDANSCTTASNVTITVTPAPVVSIIPDYCSVPNKVQLTASSVPAAYSYVWNTGETIAVIAVDEAKLYTVSARTSLNCVATGVISIAQELVKNGDFEAGNNGFFSQYGYVAPGGSLYSEGYYAVDTNANKYHNNFFGKDHTTPNQTGKFMIVNGYGNSKIIWEETVSVLPNTNYYYSAWAMNLNNVGNSFAKLQFSVNGVPIGSAATNGIADLSAGTVPKPSNNSMVNINNWIRFYYGNTEGWNSGSNTTAKIQIINLNPDLSGNDFGLDDISFATLSTFITITSPPGTDAQVLCRSNPLTNITYSVGSGGTPNVTGLPNGVTAEFKNGMTLVISGVPDDEAGVYHYTITTTGSCSNPTTATGTITINAQKVTLTSAVGTDAQSKCVNTPITLIRYTLSQLATGATVTGLPGGVTYSQAGNVVTISGTPTLAGIFTYKIKTSGTCNSDSLTGTINSTVQTISAAANNIQAVCINKAIANIIYTIGGTGTNATVVGLPAGITGTYSGGSLTISGTPSVSGTFNYTVTTIGSCTAAAATGIITVSPNVSIGLFSGSDIQTICYNSGIGNITYLVSGATSASVSGLPAGVNGTFNSGTVTISGTPLQSGFFTYTITATGNCVQATATGTIKVDNSADAGTLSSTYNTLCSSPNGTLTLTGSTGTIKRWESSIDAGNNWLPITNTNKTYDFSINTTTYFRAVLNGGVCGDTYSNPIQLGVHNLWSGKVSTDWNDANNWSDGNLPSVSCADVVIPGAMPFQPTLGSGSATIINLKIQNGAILTLNNATLKVAGTIENAGTFNGKTGTLDLNSTLDAQIIPENTFKDNALGNLVVTNSTPLGITLAGKLDIYHSLTFGASGKNLSTGGNLTMKSTATETAWVGDLTGHSINGNVTVERYINIGTNSGEHAKAWEFLAIPTSGQTVNQSWMEGNLPGQNSHPGYGTQITGVGGPAAGFDVASPSPSMKTYDAASASSWTGILNPSIQIFNPKGYMLFVRGDRSVDGSNGNTTPKATTLRTTGQLTTGTKTFAVTAKPDALTSVGNPYAASIDMKKVMADKTWAPAGDDEFFIVWNSNLGGAYTYGAYQTFFQLSPGDDFIEVPGVGLSNNYIQSGQAFFVQNSSGNAGNLVIKEQSKAKISSGFTPFFKPNGHAKTLQLLRTNLYIINADGSTTLSDGTLQQFDEGYSNGIDGMDGKKILNSSENLSIKSGGKNLIVERRQIPKEQDTIFYSLTTVKVQNYRLEFTASNFSSSAQGYIEDIYLGTKKALAPEGKTTFDFAVTNVAASYAANRFRIVFKTATALPVTFVSVKGYAKGSDIAVEWKVENERNMQQYEVEKSIDGRSFKGAATVIAGNKGAGSYSWLDKQASPGYNYYRIQSVDMSGKVNYSEIVKVQMGNIASEIIVFPNPVINGIINLKFTNQPAGRYSIRLLNPLGQVIVSKQMERTDGNSSESLNWDYNLAHGVYQIEVTMPNGEIKVLKVMY